MKNYHHFFDFFFPEDFLSGCCCSSNYFASSSEGPSLVKSSSNYPSSIQPSFGVRSFATYPFSSC